MTDRSARLAYRYPFVGILGALLGAAAPPSCGETCDLCTASYTQRWPEDRTCLSNRKECADDCERCMNTVFAIMGLTCSQNWSGRCAHYAATMCEPKVCSRQ